MTAKALAAPLLLALALSACSSAPQHPAPQLPDTWFSAAGAHPADAESLASWWRQFDDPQLTALVHRAMQQNHDVRLAMARVDSARAQLRQSRAGLLPSFDLPGSASRQWIENDQDAEPGS
ncbi:MAG: RND transporter, partial [Stutzerimonas stutzeri]